MEKFTKKNIARWIQLGGLAILVLFVALVLMVMFGIMIVVFEGAPPSFGARDALADILSWSWWVKAPLLIWALCGVFLTYWEYKQPEQEQESEQEQE